MRAPVLRNIGRPMIIEDVELDPPQTGEVLVHMVASGVCHSCLSVWDGSVIGIPLPTVLGDEGAGIVSEVGPGVTKIQPGDHVILSWAPTCGRCRYCVSGRPVLCENQPPVGRLADGTLRMHAGDEEIFQYGGVYASEVVVPESCAIPIRRDMPLDKAALIGCSVMTGIGAVTRTADVPVGASLAVFGCGGVGLNAVQGGVLAGAHPIIAVDVADTKLEMAMAMGATHGVRGDITDVGAAIRDIVHRGVEYAIVAVGNERAVQQAWSSLAPGATCVMAGILPTGKTIALEASKLESEVRLIGSCYGSARPSDDFPRLVDLYIAGKLRLDELITRRYGLDEVNEAHDALAAGGLSGRSILMYE